jgi:hypothetical protein
MDELKVETTRVNRVEEVTEHDFWAGKEACWEKCHCPDTIRAECPATKYQFLPCWEIEGTYCKLDDMGATGRDTSICQVCQVYRKYGNGEPVRLRLFGRGLDAQHRALEAIQR